MGDGQEPPDTQVFEVLSVRSQCGDERGGWRIMTKSLEQAAHNYAEAQGYTKGTIRAAARKAYIDAFALGRVAEQAERQIGTAQLIALEFGFKAHERGDNLQKAVSDFQKLRRS
jgi:hypothetical protein